MIGVRDGRHARRPDLSVQGGRVGLAHPGEPDLGVARVEPRCSAATESPVSSTSTLRPRSRCGSSAALGTALKRGARVVGEPRGGSRVPDDQAGDDLRPHCRRGRRRRPARAPCRGRPSPAEDGGLRGGLPRRHEPGRSRARPDPLLRTARHPALAQPRRRRSRRTSRAASSGASASADIGSISYPARVRESYAQDLLAGLDAGAIKRPRVPDRRRLRILGGLVRAAARARPARRRGRLRARLHDGPHRRRARAARARRSARSKQLVPAVGADLGVVLDRAAERLYLVDEQGREVPVDQSAAAVPPPARHERQARASSPSRSPSRARSTGCSRAVGSRSSGRPPRSPI